MSDNNKQQGTSLGKRLALIGVAVAIIVIAHFLPTPEGLSYAGKMAIALMVSGIVLWVTEPVPMAISGLALMCLMPGFGIFPYNGTPGVWANFISNVIFFILASFGITSALLKTKIPTKIVFTLMHITKGNAKLTVLMFMIATAVISAFVSNLPCTALFAGIAMSSIIEVEQKNGTAKHAANLGKALMIGIAYASCMGGMITPAGSALNIMTLNMLGANAGFTISFLDWVIICAPIALILLVVCWLSVVFIFKTDRISEETMLAIEKSGASVGKLDGFDKKVLAILALMIVAWVASNWTGWDATAIAVAGLALFFLPGIDVLTWKEYIASVQWAIVLLIGCVQSIAGGIKEQGAASWLFGATVGKMAVSAFAVVAATAVALPLMRLIIPVGPALIAISLIPLAGMGPAMGVSAAVFAIIIAFNANTTFLLGVDSNNMLSFRYGYWKMTDFFKAGVLPTLAMMALHATVLAPLVAAVGY